MTPAAPKLSRMIFKYGKVDKRKYDIAIVEPVTLIH